VFVLKLKNKMKKLRFCNGHEVHRVQTHTIYMMQVDKNRHNRTINSEVGGRTTGLVTFLTLLFANP